MSDPIQSSSSIPLPSYQTLQGTRDPLPVTSPKAIERDAATRVEADRTDDMQAFQDYLDQGSITMVEDLNRKRQLDAADLIGRGSIYGQPGTSVGP
jgi:hypothetical protein